MLLDVTKFTALAGTIGIGLLAGILVGTGLAAWTAKGCQRPPGYCDFNWKIDCLQESCRR